MSDRDINQEMLHALELCKRDILPYLRFDRDYSPGREVGEARDAVLRAIRHAHGED
jgi:hypothetical protein